MLLQGAVLTFCSTSCMVPSKSPSISTPFAMSSSSGGPASSSYTCKPLFGAEHLAVTHAQAGRQACIDTHAHTHKHTRTHTHTLTHTYTHTHTCRRALHTQTCRCACACTREHSLQVFNLPCALFLTYRDTCRQICTQRRRHVATRPFIDGDTPHTCVREGSGDGDM
jgi:hypothetical protein